MSLLKTIKITIALCVLTLTACTYSKVTTDIATEVNVDIAPQGSMALELPAKALFNTELSQQMDISYGDTSHQLVLLTAFNANGIAIVALTPAGIPLFELSFNENKQIEVTKHLPISGLKPEYVLADLQLVYWPITQLNQQLSNGLRIIENSQGQRTVLQNNQPVIRIQPQGNTLQYQHLLRNYHFTITNIE